MEDAERLRIEKMERALAAALYTLNEIAIRDDLIGCDLGDVEGCCSLCQAAGCIQWRRWLIISALAPKTIEDFGYVDVTKEDAD